MTSAAQRRLEEGMRAFTEASRKFSHEINALLPPRSPWEKFWDWIGYHAEHVWCWVTGRV